MPLCAITRFPPPDAPPVPCQLFPPEQEPPFEPIQVIEPLAPTVKFPLTIKIIKPPVPCCVPDTLPEVISFPPVGFPTPPEVQAV